MTENIILSIFLGINTITDIKNRTIYVVITLFFGILGMVMFVCGEEKDIFSLAGGIMAGTYLLVFSVLTRGAIGFGDGLVVLVTGIWLGGGKTLLVLMGGFFLLAIIGLAGIGAKRMNGKSELPFVPFFTLSYIVFYVGGLI